MVEPPLANGSEFQLEPAGHNVDGDAALGKVVDGCNLLGCDGWVPWARKQGDDEFQLLCLGQQCVRKAHGFVLVCGAVAGHEADLRQGILEAELLGGAGVFHVGLVIPTGVLRDLTHDESARNVRHPVSKLEAIWLGVDLVVVAQIALCLAIAVANDGRRGEGWWCVGTAVAAASLSNLNDNSLAADGP